MLPIKPRLPWNTFRNNSSLPTLIPTEIQQHQIVTSDNTGNQTDSMDSAKQDSFARFLDYEQQTVQNNNTP